MLLKLTLTLIGLLLAVGGANLFLRWSDGDISVYLTNRTSAPKVVRAADEWTGTILGTWTIPPGGPVLVYRDLLPHWWETNDLTHSQGIVVQVMDGARCTVVDQQIVIPPWGLLEIDQAGLLTDTANGMVSDQTPVVSGSAVPTENPCPTAVPTPSL